MVAAAANPLHIYAGQDFYVPAFVVLVEGRKMREELNDVMSISYSDSLANIDSFEMTVNNWDPDGGPLGGFKYSDSDKFNPWKDVEVHMGYYLDGQAQLSKMLIGEITTLTPNFPQSGPATLTVRGLNILHRFRTKQETRPFFDQKDTQIAQTLVNDIAKELRKKSKQLKLELDPEDVRRNLADDREQKMGYLVMNNQFPISFLMERARDLGYEITVDEGAEGSDRKVTLGFRPSSEVKRKTYILEWGKSLISFQPTLQVANQVAELTVRGWNPRTKKPIKVTVKRSEIKSIVSPSELGVQEPDLAKKLEIVVDRPLANEAEARLLATNRLKQIGEVLVEAKGKTVGLPEIRAGVKLEIKGLGTRFTGTYVVTASTHTIGDGGYTTDFSARMEKL